ncbi:MAG: shikimate dehydrogenase [Devosia nanyangense]|uniref:Shikimate dehydrogenase n=1 Tax=Devosia nanyangense TaxID=1228055 RepID=A0A933L6H8_9HYPH|nr:shikimate dehydrogenase [Devosia nanyangense]
MSALEPARVPTLYFIGVTTGQSSILKVFPAWATELGLGTVAIKGIDLPLHASPEAYREVVAFIRSDPLSLGALVTTHKIDLFRAARDLFDECDAFSTQMGETSCISKRDGRLICHAKDPVSSGLALASFVPASHWKTTGAELFCMGAGGSTIAITWYLSRAEFGPNRPSRIIVSNRSEARLAEIERIHRELAFDVPTEYVLAPRPEDNDAVVRGLKSHSLVVNATGLGKDAPGSPLTDVVVFPRQALVWDLNYRGDLVFLDQARAQAKQSELTVEDGWVYFLHGWTQVIAEVFHVRIEPSGAGFDQLSAIARRVGSVAPIGSK